MTTVGILTIKLKKNKKGNLPRNDISIFSNGQIYKMEALVLDSSESTKYSLALLNKIFSICEEGKFSWNVQFKLENGKPVSIYEEGAQWDREDIPDKTITNHLVNKTSGATPKAVDVNNFHNPYNFVPALPRNQVTSELGDRSPYGHSFYHGDCYSGRISVELTTVTPLLVPDASLEDKDKNTDHKTYPIRIGVDGKPYLPPTSIKGMLRSAYEAITNSRLAVFEDHDSRLAYRMPAKKGTSVKPARLENIEGKLYLKILEDFSCIGGAAKLPRYDKTGQKPDKGEKKNALAYEGTKNLPQHGDRVQVILSKGKVTRIKKLKDDQDPDHGWRLGWACVTGANINGKQNERVFLDDPDGVKILVDTKIKELWEDLIKDYQVTHKKDLEERTRKHQSPNDYLGHTPGQTAWSRHIYDKDQLTLQEGTLCYVEINGNGTSITALQPVTISRRLYAQRPSDLLPKSLHPAQEYDQLSPADRVFGWVKQGGKGSYKGQIRVHSVECNDDNCIENFPNGGVPLAILGQPKPAQTRFYTAENTEGNAINSGKPKEYGYESQKRGLRGRKVYPHHQGLPSDYWENPIKDKTQDNTSGYYQEYRRPSGKDERDSQNRSVTGWVKPNSQFTFEIDIVNLSSIELGALLWLLNFPDPDVYHRLGGGKPLGFGSVRLTIKDIDLRLGREWKAFYSSLDGQPYSKNNNLKESLIQSFKAEVKAQYAKGKDFNNVSFIAAFMRCSQGFNDGCPIHYPRENDKPDKDGKNYEWFTENEAGDQLSLPDLASGNSLPLKARTTSKNSQGKQSATTTKAFARPNNQSQKRQKS